jgi:hypothetical protein
MDRRWLGRGALVLGVVLQVVPLLITRVVPFHDAAGFIGLAGVLGHLGDPATRGFYEVDLGFYPSWIPFAWAGAAALVRVPADVALNLFTAIFCLAGPPLALWWALRAFGRREELALLALPFGYHHQIWYGFLGSAAGVTGLLAALAAARRAVDGERPGPLLALAGALLFVAGCHPFSLALTLVVVAPMFFFPAGERPWRARLLRAAAFFPTALFLAGWARSFFGGGGGGERPLGGAFGGPRPGPAVHAATFIEWCNGGYRGHLDELVVAVALVSLAAFLVLGARAGEPRSPTVARGEAIWLGGAAALLAAGFLLLPDKVYWPTYWWGVRVRCVVPLVLVSIVAIRPARRGLPAVAALPALAAALLFAIYVSADFAGPWRRALDGFDEAIAAIPPGHSLLEMPALPDPHYTLGHPYLGQYYVARTGGRAVPYLGGHPGSYWVTMKPPPPSPPWGDPAQFDWSLHGAGYDYFLLERTGVDPLAGNPAVTVVVERGRWKLYRRQP